MKVNNDKAKKNGPLVKSANLFPVVGIGASAGGLDAFKKVVKAIPENSGIAYVLVQHLSPSHESLLPDLLQKVTRVPVLEISDNIRVEPDHIYIIPSNKMLIANDGVLILTPRPPLNKNKQYLSIDLFFTSLAEVHQTHSIGVVLSGTASDGTLGLKAIKDHGGITFAQDAESAEYDSMPNSAVQAGVVDFILPPEKIPEKIQELTNEINKKIEGKFLSKDDNVFRQINALLRLRKGTDFTYYKQTTIQRRILRRMVLTKMEAPSGYLQFLRENTTEQDVLYQDLLIPVTTFFRDPKTFNILSEKALPLIIKNKMTSGPIRIWVAGCSTGQEAYSIAICFKEFLGDGLEKVQIFATDINEMAIAKARKGEYLKSELDGLTPERLQKFFTKTSGSYLVNKDVKDICLFAHHDFLKDPPFGKLDLISCRNVLIYMEPFLQKKALTQFHFALNLKGFLLLGKSETTSGVPDLFASTFKSEKLFSRKDVPGKPMVFASQRNEKGLGEWGAPSNGEKLRTDFQKTADDLILSKYTPAGVVVNEMMDIVHFRGRTNTYLEHSEGEPSHNLLKMAINGLSFELRNIWHKVKKVKASVIKENIKLQINNRLHIITIEVIPLPNIAEPHYLILFHDKPLIESAEKTQKISSGKTKKDDKDMVIRQLELELAQIREDMRGISEDQGAANEELQSANEELESGSEELQSLNEELETTKEELQSTNEELTVVNQELTGLNEQVTEERNYIQSIVETVREPLLVLDKDLRVKSANRSFYKTFLANELETEGRLIYELGRKEWNIAELRTLLETLVSKNKGFFDFEVNIHFTTIGERTMLLNATELRRDATYGKLMLLAIEDITDRKLHQLNESKFLRRFQEIITQAPVGVSIFMGADLMVEMANEAFLKMVDKKENEFVGKPLFETAITETRSVTEPLLLEVLKKGIPYYGYDFEITINRFGQNETCYFDFAFQPLREINGSIVGVVCVANEITTQVWARKKMEAQATMVHNLLMTAPGFVCTLKGPDHVYDLVNDRYQQLFGKRNIQGKPLMEALPELEGQGFDKLLDKVYTTGEPYVGVDIPITLAREINLTPELRYFNFSCQPIYDEGNKIFSILVFGYEVTDQVLANHKISELQQLNARELEEKVQHRTTELKEAMEMLEQKNQDLANMNKELESFAYISSHDLQEPLRKIQTFATRILGTDHNALSDKGKESFHKIQNSALRMQILIQDLLTYSRTANLERKFVNTDLNTILDEVKDDFEEIIREKKATIEGNDLCEASIIPFQFHQMLFNLIGNSLKFSKPGKPPHIIITSGIDKGSKFKNKELSAEKIYCHISVSDNGIGFEPRYKEKIFEVFQRLYGRDEYPGTGIGLSIVKRIVENHNGIITATGELNKGATFDIYIPANGHEETDSPQNLHLAKKSR